MAGVLPWKPIILSSTQISQAHKTFGIVGSDVAQDIIPFSACVQNLLTQDNGSCTISQENLSKERSPLRWASGLILPHIRLMFSTRPRKAIISSNIISTHARWFLSGKADSLAANFALS